MGPHEFNGSEPVADPPAPATGEALWEAVLDQMAEAAIFVDMAGRVVRCNRAIQTMAPWLKPGMGREERHRFARFYQADGEPLASGDHPTALALRGIEVPTREYAVQVEDGPRLALMISASPIRVAGRQVGALIVAHDVTGRRLVEDALRASEARWRGLVEHAPAVIVVLDPEDRIRYLSRGVLDGPLEDFVGHLADEFFDEPHRGRYRAAREEVRRTGRPARLELAARGPGGEPGWYDLGLAPIDQGGAQGFLVGVAVDVTARKRAQEELGEQRHLMVQAERNAAMGSWCLDLRTGAIRWSEGLFRILGYKPGSVTPGPDTFRARMRPEDRAALEENYQDLVTGELPMAFEFQVVRPDGEARTVRVRGTIERDEQGRPAKTVGVMFDVTDQLEMERMKNEFISTVSHELRTPLTAIRAPLTLLVRSWAELAPEATQEMLGIALDGVDRMVRLVNDVLDMQRLATGRLSVAPEATDARNLVAEARQALAPRAEAARVKVRSTAPSLPLRTDPARVVQVLTNLLDNAISYSSPGQQVDVRVRRLDGQLRFDVSDRGPGIPADQLEAVFERFKQLDQGTKRRKGGTGLGLAICREIVDLLGGRIWAERRRGGGSTFSFVLPG